MVQVIRIFDFARGMTQKRRGKLLPFNAAAVIRHTDELNTAFFCLYRNRRGTGIYGIFHQLLHHAGRSFYHLTGSDPVDRPGVQYMYSHISTYAFPLYLTVPAVLQLIL